MGRELMSQTVLLLNTLHKIKNPITIAQFYAHRKEVCRFNGLVPS